MVDTAKYSVIYKFEIKNEFEREFIQTWNEITKLIYKYEGSLGSRLQKIDSNNFLGYALWPNIETFQKADFVKNNEIEILKEKQKQYINNVERIFESIIVSDLIN